MFSCLAMIPLLRICGASNSNIQKHARPLAFESTCTEGRPHDAINLETAAVAGGVCAVLELRLHRRQVGYARQRGIQPAVLALPAGVGVPGAVFEREAVEGDLGSDSPLRRDRLSLAVPLPELPVC